MEDNHALYDSYKMTLSDNERVSSILDSIVKDGRIAKGLESYQILNS